MKTLAVSLLLLLNGVIAHAETPQQILQAYAAAAAAESPGFAPSPERGSTLYHATFRNNDKLPSCSTCHTERPTDQGKHAITGKAIRPMAVSADSDRFTDPAKVEKWFGRNCKEIIGRACTAAEKADFIAYLSESR